MSRKKYTPEYNIRAETACRPLQGGIEPNGAVEKLKNNEGRQAACVHQNTNATTTNYAHGYEYGRKEQLFPIEGLAMF